MKRLGLSVLTLVILQGTAAAGICFGQTQQSSQLARPQASQTQFAPQPPPPPPPQEDTAITVAAIDTPDLVTDSTADHAKIIYVSDFELDAVNGQGKF